MPPQPQGQQQKGTKLDRFFSCQDTKPQYRRLQQSRHYAWQRGHQGDCTSSTFWILEVPVSFDGGLCRSGEAPLLHTTREWRPLPCHHTGIGSLWLYALSVGSWTDGRAYLPMFVSPTSQCLWDKLSVGDMPFVTLMRTNPTNTAKHLPWDERPMMAKAWQWRTFHPLSPLSVATSHLDLSGVCKWRHSETAHGQVVPQIIAIHNVFTTVKFRYSAWDLIWEANTFGQVELRMPC